jgi:hypothetical protein
MEALDWFEMLEKNKQALYIWEEKSIMKAHEISN